jgi:hypothetical protein
MQRRNHSTVTFRFAEVSVDEVHAVIGQLSFVDQVVLDAAGAFLTQLA